jgi:hypothetical protein
VMLEGEGIVCVRRMEDDQAADFEGLLP